MESNNNEQVSNDEEEECEEETEEREIEILVHNDLNIQSYSQNLMSNSNDNCSVVGGVSKDQQNTSLDNNSNTIYFLIEQFMNQRGWNLFDKDGNLIKSFTSLELFKHLTENILANNIQLNNFFILNNIIKDNRYLGGELYLSLMNIIPLILRKQQYEFNLSLLLQMNNNGGTNLLNNNGINFNPNNFNNNYFNQYNSNNNNMFNNMFNNNINNFNNSNINNYNLNNFNDSNNNMINLNNMNNNMINYNNKDKDI